MNQLLAILAVLALLLFGCTSSIDGQTDFISAPEHMGKLQMDPAQAFGLTGTWWVGNIERGPGMYINLEQNGEYIEGRFLGADAEWWHWLRIGMFLSGARIDPEQLNDVQLHMKRNGNYLSGRHIVESFSSLPGCPRERTN
jgi:hypothetical protein